MTFLNKLNRARVKGKIFARWHLAIAIASECIFLIALKITTILSEKKKLSKLLATKMVPSVRIDDKLKGKLPSLIHDVFRTSVEEVHV